MHIRRKQPFRVNMNMNIVNILNKMNIGEHAMFTGEHAMFKSEHSMFMCEHEHFFLFMN